MKKFYDSQSANSYVDHWAGPDTSYNIIGEDGKAAGKVTTAWVGTPESQGYEDIRTSDDPFAVSWREDKRLNEIDRLEKRLDELKG
jgi:hypothetical protein